MMKAYSFSERLKEALEKREVRQVELSSGTNIPKSAISQYLSGNFEPKQDRVHEIALFLNVSEAWLMGFDVPMEREQSLSPEKEHLMSAIKDLTIEQLEEVLTFVDYLKMKQEKDN